MQNYGELSRLEINLVAQKKANDALLKTQQRLWGETINFHSALSNPALMHEYIIAFTMAAIEEYHLQLQAALKLKGVDIGNFIEVPLYPSQNL